MAKTGIGVRPENRCVAQRKKDGRRCGAAKAVLKTVDGDIVRYRVCLGHLIKYAGPGQILERHGFDPHAPKANAGRPRKPSAIEVLRWKVEEEYGIDNVLAPMFEALDASRAVVVGNGPSARVELVGDVTESRRAAESILDRVYGKPRQAMELTGANGGAIQVDVPDTEERARDVARILMGTGSLEALAADISENGHTNGNGSDNGAS